MHSWSSEQGKSRGKELEGQPPENADKASNLHTTRESLCLVLESVRLLQIWKEEVFCSPHRLWQVNISQGWEVVQLLAISYLERSSNNFTFSDAYLRTECSKSHRGIESIFSHFQHVRMERIMNGVCEDLSPGRGLVVDMLYVTLAKSFYPSISNLVCKRHRQIIFIP